MARERQRGGHGRRNSRRPAAQAESHGVDVTDAAGVEALVAGVIERHGRIDVLVNNAGITRDQLMLRMKRADWDEVLATNLTGVVHLCQAVLKPMLQQRAGRIVTISSVVGPDGQRRARPTTRRRRPG